MMLAIIDDPEVVHGPLDLCFTLHEEVGLTGAYHLDPGLLQGDVLLNLDSEEDDELTIGSAGGRDVKFRWTRDLTPIEGGWIGLTLMVSGLRGGHSGLDINSGRLNAIRGLVRLLQVAAEKSPIRLLQIKGGDRRNAIPRAAHAVVALPADRLANVRVAVDGEWATVKEQYRDLEPKGALEVEELGQAQGSAFTVEVTRQLLAGLRTIPAGVVAMSQDVPGLVETSNNLGVIDTNGGVVDWVCSPRSSLSGAMKDITETLLATAELVGATADPSPEYPGWKPEPSSPVLAVVKLAYERLFGSPVKVGACHAGLECSVIKAKLPHLDCVSMGPTIKGAHSTTERVRIDSVAKTYNLLKTVLRDLSTPSG
jgi:dipeptidase D